MDRTQLTKLMDYILNEAPDDEVQALSMAVQKRMQGPPGMKVGGQIKNMAQATRKTMNNQVQQTMDNVQGSVRDYVKALIKKEAPGIPNAHMDALLAEWVPSPGQKQKLKTTIKPELLMEMVRQFIDYSIRRMSAEEKAALEKEVPKWPEKYWKAFPPQLQKMLSDLLKSEIDESDFWLNLAQMLD